MNFGSQNPYMFGVPEPSLYYPQMYGINPGQPPAQTIRNKIYVSGIEGARSYPIGAGSEALFLDNEKSVIYDVLVDNSGKRTVSAYDIVPHQEVPPVDPSVYATREELLKLREEIERLKGAKDA